MITYLMCGKEFWSTEIKVIRRFGLGLVRDKCADLHQIVEEKSKPIKLLKLTCQEREPSTREMELAEIVSACTSYDPDLRLSLEELAVALRKLVEERRDGGSRLNLATDLHSQPPRAEDNGAAGKVSNESGEEGKRESRRGHSLKIAAAGTLCALCFLVFAPPLGVSKLVTDAITSIAGAVGIIQKSGDLLNDLPGCVSVTKQPDGHVYALVELNDDWRLAKERAESYGGHLATIASPEEQRVVEGILALGTRNSYWLGGSLGPDESWAWVTGEQFGYKNWATDQPDNFLVRTSQDDVPSAPVEDALVVYRVTNEQAADDGRGFFGFWNDLPRKGDCGGEAFFGVNNIGAIYEWDNGLPHASGL